MIRIAIRDLHPRSQRLTGSIIGDAHAEQINDLCVNGRSQIAILDFAEVEGASASYLKRILKQWTGSSTDRKSTSDSVSAIVINISNEDLFEDLETYLYSAGKVIIEATDEGHLIRFRRVLGPLEGAAAETFDELIKWPQVTAQQLFEIHPERTTNQTAWNNRLAQLVELKIARRHKEGRFWIYKPLLTT